MLIRIKWNKLAALLSNNLKKKTFYNEKHLIKLIKAKNARSNTSVCNIKNLVHAN